MNQPLFMLSLGVFLVSMVIGHAVWCKVRIARLRRDISGLRLVLFKSAEDAGQLQSAAYLKWDEAIHGILESADDLSLPVWIHSCLSTDKSETNNQAFPVTGHAELDLLGMRTLAKVFGRITVFAVFETLCGVAATSLLRVAIGARAATKLIARAGDAFASSAKSSFSNHNHLVLR